MHFSKILPLSLFALAAAASPQARSPGLDEVAAVFKKEGVVPNVLSSFKPVAYLYETYKLANGTYKTVLPNTPLAREDTQAIPEFSVKVDATATPWATTKKFVLAIVDPDAPSRETPTRGQIRHLLATDVLAGSASTRVEGARTLSFPVSPVSPYRGPSPPAGSGYHRYISLLYAQPPKLDISFLDVANVSNWNVEDFAKKAGLGEPLAGTFFIAQVL
ncbi:hypothetical protein BOTBODRAFT_183595 [Botryobasidium botryosum FD-172 SS1]|uniref:PEBP-like protein n=1 Tax=Botryobasidium botryosum (strain FD-172 SS1) TaxID=930990 RepID=A0A067N1S6_BOTB1|nr:hypothetical protein BOTBODRAFT_183595 [Botryobasidium botryosum FD-172 SS1]